MKILNGVYPKESGEIKLFGTTVDFSSPEMSRQAGISMVFQDLSLIPTLTVAENIFLRSVPYRRGLLIDDTRCNERVQQMLRTVGVGAQILPTDKVEDISSGQKQIVEIIKALSNDPKILILDEPTASLTHAEIKILFLVIQRLQEEGISIIYITHYLRDVFSICDRVTVLRDGATVLKSKTSDITMSRLVAAMVGTATQEISWTHREKRPAVTPLMEVVRLETAHVHDVSLQIQRGEIVGIAGLLGSGRSELMNALFGVDPILAGKIRIDGVDQPINSTADAIKAGISLVPENRREQGLILDFSVSDNIVMPVINRLKKMMLVDEEKVSDLVTRSVESLDIKTRGPRQIVRFLSGGNQQKIVVAKCLAGDAQVLLLDDPTFGVDIHAKQEIMKIIRDYVDRGNGAVFISSEFKEIAAFCDTIYIMKRGGITDCITTPVSEDDLLHSVQ